jgi:hypothetical protein
MASAYEAQYFGAPEFHFAERVAVHQREGVVYLDFLQVDPESGDQHGVARIVMLPSLAADLAERLSALRKPE